MSAHTILVIDNYDSFAHNLARYIRLAGYEIEVVRNDDTTPEAVLARAGTDIAGLVLSPGPCTPATAGICVPLIRRAAGHLPILGVCLGHQAIGEAFGGRTIKAPEPVHGRACHITFNEDESLFKGLAQQFQAGRYHALISDISAAPDLIATAHSADSQRILMAMRHKTHPIFGIQFHPESILTPCGHNIIQNFCDIVDHTAMLRSGA